jgi:hypothetical protein
MALTGSFLADFTSFYDAAQQADVHLKGMETNANKVESSLNKMVDSFSGRKLAQDATLMVEAIERMGGATKLTEAEQAKVNRTVTEAIAKYKALGMEAPAELQKVAEATKGAEKGTSAWSGALSTMTGALGAMGVQLSVGAVVNFISDTVEAAGAINDLADKTGVSTTAIQQWKFAAEQGGATIDSVNAAVSGMNRVLAAGDKSTIESLRHVGLEFTKLRTDKPEDAFNAIVAAAEKIADPMERARFVTEMFTKAGQDLLPAIAGGFTATAQGAATMSEETVKRLAAAGDAWDAFKNRIVIVTGEALAATKGWLDKTNDYMEHFSNRLGNVWSMGWQGAKDYEDQTVAAAAATAAAGKVSEEEAEKRRRQGAEAAIEYQKQQADKKKLDDEAETARKKAAADAQRDAKALADLHDHLFGADLREKAAQYAKALGDVGNVAQLTKAAQAEMNTVMGAAYAALLKAGEGASAAAKQYRDLQLATTDWAAINTSLAASTDAQEDSFWTKRQERTRQQLTSQLDVIQGLRDTSGGYVETAAEAEASGIAANEAMLKAVTAIQTVPPAAGEATAAVNTYAAAMINAGNSADTLADRQAKVWGRHAMDAEYRKNTFVGLPSLGLSWYNMEEERRAGLTIGPNQTTEWPQLSEGGVGNFGSGTPVMLHGQEAVVPLDRAGGFGGVNAAVTININGHMDPARAGRDAGEALIAYLKSRGARI